MGIADQIWQQFLATHPEAKSGKLTLEQINAKMQAFMLEQNRRPHLDFEGLSPEQMHGLLHHPFSVQSVIRLQDHYPDEVLDQIAFFRLMEMLWEELRQKEQIKLTPKGNFQLELCRRLYQAKFITQKDIERGITKKISEDNIAFLMALKAVLSLSEWVKKRNNALSLTKAGEKALLESRSFRFRAVLRDYTTRFNWSYLDLADSTQAGQLGWAFSLHLLHGYGGEFQQDRFYAQKLLKAFPLLFKPIFPSPHPDPVSDFALVYRWRFLEQFAFWFGLVELEYHKQEQVYRDKLLVRKSPLLEKIFSFEAKRPG